MRQAGNSDQTPATLGALLDEVIGALTAADAERMEWLLLASRKIAPTSRECRDATPKHQVLGHLLRETGRNLRMLRRLDAGPEQLLRYGPR